MSNSKGQNNPILVVVCALGLFAFMVLVIYPNYRTLAEQDRQIAALNEEITLRRSLAPIYQKLVKKVRISPSAQLKIPQRKALNTDDTTRLTGLFQGIAATADLVLESVIPDVRDLNQAEGRLKVDVVFRGAFLNLQTLINTIAAQGYVDRIETIQVRSDNSSKKWIQLTVSLFHQ
ncbi:MAG: hypothetical protein CR984_01515 [Proteobacteria bacterium]|nr:MAG: hypothetical protein CR984_01515 [Pseudomonadota bacterium]PIE67665.1 MAG: hypothetical protein CSA23_02505 [Deltaproteobacteria bacterium]